MPTMIPQSPNQQPSPKKQPKIRKSWIVLGVVVVVFIIFLIVNGANSGSTPEPPVTSVPDTPSSVVPEPEPEPEPIVQTTSGALEDITPPKESAFTRSDASFIFNKDISFPSATPMADQNAITLGQYITFTPLKSCAFKFSTNKVDIAYSSNAVMSIQRSSFRGDLVYDDVDAAITENFTEGLAGEVTLSNVYLGSTKRGRSGSGQVKFGETTYYMSLTYVFSNDEVATIVAVSEVGDEDFIDILYRNLSISGQKLTMS